ncbi:MAG: 30S ribosomal protein S6 [Rhodospirillaceae bacterium]|jgi:small subunit ribosomal protein S6|nr:30S ribosomal protein S6 [Rhodospirillaceae bacterium]
MPLYESVFIVRPDVSSSQVETLAQEMSTIIDENGGSVPKVEHWGLKNLSYRIKKNRKAYYVLFNIDSPHAAVAEMERNMSIHEDVLRHMTLRLDELEEGPSIMMQNKASRDDRRPRGGDRGGYGGKRSDERKPEEAKAEEPKSEEAAAEEPKSEEAAAEEPKSEEAAAEEPKSEEAKDAAAKPADDAATETAPDTATETATETTSADNASETTAAGEDK